MTESKSNQKGFLASPADWEDWSREFIAQAQSGELWEHIDPDIPEVPLLKKPVEPQISDYFVKQNVTPTPTSTADSSTPQETPERTKATSYQQLSGDDQRAYTFELGRFEFKTKEYKEQKRQVKSLIKWVGKSVSAEYTRICCHPKDSLRTWYKELEDAASITESERLLRLNKRYQEAVRPLFRAPRDFDTWINR